MASEYHLRGVDSAAVRQSGIAARAIADGAAWPASVWVSRDLEMSQFWQKRQQLHTVDPRIRASHNYQKAAPPATDQDVTPVPLQGCRSTSGA
jgi:hypothetical protein